MNHAPKWPTEFRRHVASTYLRTYVLIHAQSRVSDHCHRGSGASCGREQQFTRKIRDDRYCTGVRFRRPGGGHSASPPPFLASFPFDVKPCRPRFFYRDRSWRAQRNAVKKRFGETVPSFPTNEFEEANSIRVPAWVGVDFSVRDVGIGRRRERRSGAGWVGNETTALLAGRWKI